MMRTKHVVETKTYEINSVATAQKTCFISDQSDHLVEKGLGSGVGLVVVDERVEVEFA